VRNRAFLSPNLLSRWVGDLPHDEFAKFGNSVPILLSGVG
jgi:hypothetical protein